MRRLRVAMIILQGVSRWAARISSGTWQLQVAQGCVVCQAVGHETGLVESVGVGEHLSGEVDHVVKVEAPFALAGIRH